MFKYNFLFIFLMAYVFGGDTFYYQNNQKIELTKLTEGDILLTHYYKTPKNKIVGVSDEIIIRLKNEANLRVLSAKYDFVVLQKISEKTYLAKVQSNIKTLDIANLIHQESDVEYAQPNFVKIPTKR